MKITCQSCQSKYTIADEKIQGKVAKIRCRKCGATIVVDGGKGAASEPAPAAVGGAPAWTVNVADGDQRTMTLAELVEAYGAGVINGDTFLWTEAMSDWAPLAEVPEIVAALGASAPAPSAEQPDRPEEPEQPEHPEPPAPAPVAESVSAPTYEPDSAPVAAAARKRPGGDLFGGAALDDEVTTSAASPASFAAALSPSAPKPVGARDEHSVLFSLSALTASSGRGSSPPASSPQAAGPSPTSSKVTEDSGLIDLNALAKAQAAQEASRAAQPAPVVPAPFLFPAALGSVEPVTAAVASTEPEKKASKMPIFIGGGIAVAGLAIALAFLATRGQEAPPPAPSATAAAAEPTPTATTTAEPSAPEPAASAAPAASEAVAPTAAAPARKATTPVKQTATSKKAAESAPAATHAPAAAPPKKSGGCGCSPADLQCQIRCSATGH